jgi:hypothetical protein
MPGLRVVCFEEAAWDQANARVVEAEDEKAAAEDVCGGRLTSKGKIGQLRAQVSPASDLPRRRFSTYQPSSWRPPGGETTFLPRRVHERDGLSSPRPAL